MTENNVAAQAGDEPMREAAAVIKLCQEWCVAMYQHAANIGAGGPGIEAALDAKAESAKAAIRSLAVSPRATADVERDELMMQCLFSIASGHTYMDNQESLHCSTCNADLDDGEEHSATCLTVRAGEYIATTKPGA